jgi:hypothetical protein
MTGADPRVTDAGATDPGATNGVDPNVDRHHASAGRFVPPSPSTVDLHTHTLRSDGLLPPAQLVEAAAAAGVRLLAITDHAARPGRAHRRRARRAPTDD